ncbi:hypothetical protein DM02DRAFT_662249 [Periconia macrospinosa]|uniref:Uncharacterized protein n=1 Tax=Periconia macrospinosa TaxID=97972 RepID=A0A2V1D568_9PLEO|nr:hypothetical protein DM02DRAFT_662249 [Periconia macrospinosa]
MPIDRNNTNTSRPWKPTLATNRTAKTPLTPHRHVTPSREWKDASRCGRRAAQDSYKQRISPTIATRPLNVIKSDSPLCSLTLPKPLPPIHFLSPRLSSIPTTSPCLGTASIKRSKSIPDLMQELLDAKKKYKGVQAERAKIAPAVTVMPQAHPAGLSQQTPHYHGQQRGGSQPVFPTGDRGKFGRIPEKKADELASIKKNNKSLSNLHRNPKTPIDGMLDRMDDRGIVLSNTEAMLVSWQGWLWACSNYVGVGPDPFHETNLAQT